MSKSDAKAPDVRINFNSAVMKSNSILAELCANVNQLHLPKFGSTINGSSPQICADSIVGHRISSKFSVIDKNISERLRREAYQSYKNFDFELHKQEFNLWGPSREHFLLRKAQRTLHQWFHKRTIDLNEDALEFTPGESFKPQRGHVSLHAKLSKKEHWTVTESCLQEACALVYYSTSLKRCAKRLIGRVSQDDRRCLYDKFRDHPNVGYAVFSHLLETRLFTVCETGARASCVPKNNEKSRFINIETTFGCLLQRIDAKCIRDVLRIQLNDLDVVIEDPTLGISYDAQEIHRRMIADSDYATVDFSNASDSVRLDVVSGMFPKHIVSLLERHRSEEVLFPDGPWAPAKLSSMGNGFTFEVMTVLLLSIARQLDPTARVYGDDVIIHNDVVDQFISVCSLISFQTNLDKTFVRSNFRESCGSFFHDDFGYIVCYDIHASETYQDVVTSHNKLYDILERSPISQPLRDVIQAAVVKLSSLFPASLKGPYEPRNLDKYVFSQGYKKRHKSCPHHRSLWQGYLNEVNLYCELTGQNHDWSLIYTNRFITLKTDYENEVADYSAFLYSQRAIKAHIRGKGRWELTPTFVSVNGDLLPLTHVKRINKDILRHIRRSLALLLLVGRASGIRGR